jgi:WD40 repeat protein
MTPDPSTPADDQFTALLIACDEALAAGIPAAVLTDVEAPGDLRPRLERGVACLRLLEQFWSTRRAADVSAAPSSGVKPLTRFGRFQVLRELGHGSFGTVFLAHDPLLGRDVALKTPRVPALLTPELRQRFRYEALAAARLDHPNLVPVYEAGVVDDICFITSPFCPGITLAAWLRQREQPVPWHEVAALAATLAEAVQHAHSRGVLHRDLKPANILLNPRPQAQGPKSDPGPAALDLGLFDPKITDFGLAKLVEGPPDQTGTGMILGTPCYMAPEQAQAKNRAITTAADVYSLGAVLYELLTARPPFLADTALATLEQVRVQEPVRPRQLQSCVPRDLETICLKCLRKDPRRRYVSAHDLAEDLRRLLAGEPIRARAVGPAERLLKWAKRHPAAAAVVGVTCLAAALLIFLSVAFHFRMTREKAATEQALQRETQANADLSRALYRHSINLAYHEWLANNVARTEELLEACPYELRQWEWRYLKGLGQRGFATLRGHAGAVTGVAFDREGKRMASGSADATVRIWDADSGQTLRTLRGHSARVDGVAFSPDGTRLASASRDRTVKVWDVASGEECCTLRDHVGEVSSVAFSPDGARLASASWDKTVNVWDLSTRRVLHKLRHGDRIFSVTFSPDGRRLASASDAVKVWDAATGDLLVTCAANPADPLIWVAGVAFHPDGRRLASANGNKTVCIWDSETGNLLRVLRSHNSGVYAVGFSPNGERLASTGFDQTVRLWNTASGAELQTVRGHTALWVSSVAWAPDGQHVASGGEDQTVRVWDALASQESLLIPGGRHAQVTYSGDGRFIATAGRYKDEVVVVWDARTLKQRARLRAPTEYVSTVAFRPDSRYLAGAGVGKTVRIWDTETWEEVGNLRGHSQSIIRLAYSPDGKRLASASMDKTVKIWDPAAGQEVRTLEGHTNPVLGVAFSPDGQYVASASDDRTVRLWNAASGEALRTLRGATLGMTSVAFDPTGKLVAAGSRDATVTIWDVATGQLACTCKGHTGAVWAIDFTADGQRLVSASDDHTVKLWDTATGYEALTLRGSIGSVYSVAFSPDGTRLVCGSDVMTVWQALPVSGR